MLQWVRTPISLSFFPLRDSKMAWAPNFPIDLLAATSSARNFSAASRYAWSGVSNRELKDVGSKTNEEQLTHRSDVLWGFRFSLRCCPYDLF